jgi:hypothetical protein
MTLEKTQETLNKIYMVLGNYIQNSKNDPNPVGFQPEYEAFSMDVQLNVGSFSRSFYDITATGAAYEATGSIKSPAGLWRLTADLRDAMYETGKGAWFSARITVAVEADKLRGFADFNYDTEPFAKTIGVDPVSYYCDSIVYPRDADVQPEWYRDIVAKGAQMVKDHNIPEVALNDFTKDREAWIKVLAESADPRV